MPPAVSRLGRNDSGESRGADPDPGRETGISGSVVVWSDGTTSRVPTGAGSRPSVRAAGSTRASARGS